MFSTSIFVLYILIVGSYGRKETPLDKELMKLSTELFNDVSINLKSQLTLNYQGKVNDSKSKDVAPKMLFTISDKVLDAVPTIKIMRKLFNEFEAEVWKNESTDERKIAKEEEFISALLTTKVINHAMTFLAEKNLIKPNINEYRRILKLIWFQMYQRSKNIIGSSGFEHVYLSEKKTPYKLVGLHNWVYFADNEKKAKLNYLGYVHHVPLTKKIQLATVEFTIDGIRKRSTIFIGSPPELEIALYTVCFFIQPGRTCKLATKDKKFSIQTFVIKSEGKSLVASAYPQL